MGNNEQEISKQMDENEGPVKQLTLSCSNLLEVLQIIHVLKKASANKPDEHQAHTDLEYAIMDNLETVANDCKIRLTRKERFSIWLCIDIYKIFCSSTNDKEQLELADDLLEIFSGK